MLGSKNAHGGLSEVHQGRRNRIHYVDGGGSPVILPPTITLYGPSEVTLRPGKEYIEQGATAIDTYQGAVKVIESGSVRRPSGAWRSCPMISTRSIEMMERVLKKAKGNLSAAARLLKVDRSKVYR